MHGFSSALLYLAVFLTSLPAQVNITTYQVDNAHTGANGQESILTPQNVAASDSFGELFSQAVDGQTYGGLLYLSNINFPDGSVHNVIYAATSHNSVYAFDADSNTGANANPLWKVNLLPEGSTPVPTSDLNTSDMVGEVGITATPVLDVASKTLYVVTKTRMDVDGTKTYAQYLHALDALTGSEKDPSPVQIKPTFDGNGAGSENGVITFNARRQNSRPSLILFQGTVYIAFSSHSDRSPYHGLILGYDAGTLQMTKSFIATPNGTEGAIWQAGCGPSIDGAGNLYVVLGNTTNQKPPGSGEWGEAFLKFPTSGDLTVTDFFVPNNYVELNRGDTDLGSSGLLLLPDQPGPHPHLMVSGGKDSRLYLVDRDDLGGNAPKGDKDKNLQTIKDSGRLFCTPSYFNGKIYYAPENSNLTSRPVKFDEPTGHYLADDGTVTHSKETYSQHGATAFISYDNNLDPSTGQNGLAWIVDQALPSVLRVYDAANVSEAIYKFTTQVAVAGQPMNLITNKFTAPIVVNGKAYFTAYEPVQEGNTGTTGHIFVLGLLPKFTSVPSAPAHLTAKATSANQITLSWTHDLVNVSGFRVLGAAHAEGPFTPIDTMGKEATTYTVRKLDPQTTSYYKLVATNNLGDSPESEIASATTPAYYRPKGLLAYWNFDEGGGTTVSDVSGQGHTGVLDGEVNWTSAYLGQAALNFHGTGNAVAHVTVADVPEFRFSSTDSFTLSAWIQPVALRNRDEGALCKSREQGNFYGIWIDAANHWVFRGPDGDVQGPVATNSWQHIAAVQDGLAGLRYLYVNGVLAAKGPAQAADGKGDLWFGQANSVSQAFPGNIDEVRLYNLAVPAGEVPALMEAPTP